MIPLFDCIQSCPQKKDDKALRLWRILFLEFFSIFPIHKSLCISWKHMKSARKRATALVLKSKRDDSIIDPLKKGILNCCCYCVVFSSCWPQAARGQVTAARAHGPPHGPRTAIAFAKVIQHKSFGELSLLVFRKLSISLCPTKCETTQYNFCT